MPRDYVHQPEWEADPGLRRWNLWGYIDTRDGALAVLRALENAGPGFETFVIANADTVVERPSAELVAEYFPNVDAEATRLTGNETLLSIDKARRMLIRAAALVEVGVVPPSRSTAGGFPPRFTSF